MDHCPIVDAHTHVVAEDREAYPLDPRPLSGQWYLNAPASAEDLLREMAASGVVQAVLVQGVGAYTYDNRYAADAAVAHPEQFVSACCIDVLAEDAPERLSYWVEERGMRGIRLFALSREGPSWLVDDRTDRIWERARVLDAHVIVTVLPHQLDEVDHALGRFPDTPVSLDHCGFALGDPSTRERLFELARHPNLNLKITTHNLDEAVRSGEGASSLVGVLFDRFGADRMMWGSDYCQTHDRPYGDLVALAREAFALLPNAAREACLSGTARRLWPGLSAASR